MREPVAGVLVGAAGRLHHAVEAYAIHHDYLPHLSSFPVTRPDDSEASHPLHEWTSPKSTLRAYPSSTRTGAGAAPRGRDARRAHRSALVTLRRAVERPLEPRGAVALIDEPEGPVERMRVIAPA